MRHSTAKHVLLTASVGLGGGCGVPFTARPGDCLHIVPGRHMPGATRYSSDRYEVGGALASYAEVNALLLEDPASHADEARARGFEAGVAASAAVGAAGVLGALSTYLATQRSRPAEGLLGAGLSVLATGIVWTALHNRSWDRAATRYNEDTRQTGECIAGISGR